MKRTLALVCFATVSSMTVHADSSTNTWWKDFNDWVAEHKVRIRQSTADKNTIEKPAQFQFVSPQDGGDNSYAIDVGLTARFWGGLVGDNNTWELGPTVEYHKQTLATKPQDNLQAGLNSILVVGDVTEGMGHYFQGVAKFKRDTKNTGNGFLGQLDYTPLDKHLWLGQARGWPELKFLWQPTIGLQYESSDDVAKTKNSGDAFRGKANAEIGIYPLATTLQKRLELVGRFTYWYRFADSGEYRNLPTDNRLWNASLNFYFDEDSHFGVGVDYVNGSDPERGLAKQELITASFKMKF